MFNLQGSEIVIILLLALVVLGPEKLPEAMRRAGQFYAELKKMSSGFQSEFRAAVDEPMREMRETANILRDSADFTKLQQGERDEKPKSAEMAPADPDAEPTDDLPTFETSGSGDDGPATAETSKPSPFSGESSAAPRPQQQQPQQRVLPPSTAVDAPPPFAAMSAPPAEPVEESVEELVDEPPASAATDAFGTLSPAPVADGEADQVDAADDDDEGV